MKTGMLYIEDGKTPMHVDRCTCRDQIIYRLKQGNMNVLESKKNYVDCDVKLCGEVLKRFTDRCCLTLIIL